MTDTVTTPTPDALPIVPGFPWDRQPDEPEDWYRRFSLYRDMGRLRTLGLAYRKTRVPHAPTDIPASWYDAFRTWDWRERALAWDESIRSAKEAERETRRNRDRDERVLVLKASRGKLIEAMQKTDATDSRYSQIVADLTTLNEQLRKESEA